MKLRQNHGMTLLELIIAISITAIIVIAASAVLVTGIKTYNVNLKSTVDLQSMRAATLHISKRVHNATTVAADATAKTLTVDGKIYSFDNTGKTLLYNGKVLAYNIASFSPSISGKLLTVVLTSTGGGTLSTELSLR